MEAHDYVKFTIGDLLVQIASLRADLDERDLLIEALKKQIFELTKEG